MPEEIDPGPGFLLLAFGVFIFALVAVLTRIVVGIRLLSQKQEQAHRERMKALEQGVLPELVRAQGEVTRARAAGAVGVLVPLVLAAAAAVGTGLLLGWQEPVWLATVLCVIWGVCGIVSLVSVTTSLGTLRRAARTQHKLAPDVGREPPAASATAIKKVVPAPVPRDEGGAVV